MCGACATNNQGHLDLQQKHIDHRWLTGRLSYAIQAQNENKNLDVLKSYRVGRDAERRFVWFYNFYEYFLLVTQRSVLASQVQ